MYLLIYIYIRNACMYIYILFDWVVTLPSNSYSRIIMYILVEDPCPHLPLLLGRGTTPYYIAYRNKCSVCTVIENCMSYIKLYCIPAHKLSLFIYFSEGTVNEKHDLLLQMGNWAPGIDPIRRMHFQLFAMEVKLRDQPVRLFYLNHGYLNQTPFFHPHDTFFTQVCCHPASFLQNGGT